MDLPLLEIFELDVHDRKFRLWNWRLIAINGEPMAHGTGERFGAFASPRSAWLNFLRVADILGARFSAAQKATPPAGAWGLFFLEDGRPFLSYRRLARPIQ
jgi:hypothetical protein